MKTARVLLIAAVATVAGTGLPGLARGQAVKPYVIDVTKPDSVAGRRFSMRQRVRVEVRGLNPFAGNYRIIVNEKAYSDSAISTFLAGLGISVSAGAPSSSHARAIEGIGDAIKREVLVQPMDCVGNCASLRSQAADLVQRFGALQERLFGLDSQDVEVRAQFHIVTSERSDSPQVMTALDNVIQVFDAQADWRHQHQSFLQEASAITSPAQELAKRLDSCPCAASICTLLHTIVDSTGNIISWAKWRDSIQDKAGATLVRLRLARDQASKMFIDVFEVGDYDYPTTVDIAIQRQPLGPLDFEALEGRVAASTSTKPDSVSPRPGSSDTASFAVGWRTIANPRLSFGERRRIGVGGALLLGIGPPTSSYGTVRTTATDSLSISETRREPAWTPLLTLTARIVAFDCPLPRWLRMPMVCAVNGHVGVSPSTTTRQTYFLGLGFAFADERMGIMIGALSLPVQRLQPGFKIGDRLNPNQTSAPTQDGRDWRLGVGLNLRPF